MNIAPVEELLREEIGLDVETIGRGAVERALRRQFAGHEEADPVALARRLRAEPALLRRVIEAVVVPETWFFRDDRPFEVLAEEALKRRVAHPERPVRVLSLPCSTGEEAWSIAIALREAGLGPGAFTVAARDVSVVALEAARRGVYGRNSFRTEPGAWRERWMTREPDGEHWRINEPVRASVDFELANLFALPAAERGHDFVFCRNLLIYFDVATQREALRRLRAQLAPGGLLFVGHAEAAVALREGFVSWPVARAFAFTAGAATTAKKIAPPTTSASRPFAAVSTPRPVAPKIVRTVAEVAPPAPLPSLTEARALADRGELAEAARIARAYVERNDSDPEAYHLLGLVHDAEGRFAEAEADYRRAVYLAPRHASALSHLALLLERRGEHDAARRLRARAEKGDGS